MDINSDLDRWANVRRQVRYRRYKLGIPNTCIFYQDKKRIYQRT